MMPFTPRPSPSQPNAPSLHPPTPLLPSRPPSPSPPDLVTLHPSPSHIFWCVYHPPDLFDPHPQIISPFIHPLAITPSPPILDPPHPHMHLPPHSYPQRTPFPSPSDYYSMPFTTQPTTHILMRILALNLVALHPQTMYPSTPTTPSTHPQSPRPSDPTP